jgi:hypothetical protein
MGVVSGLTNDTVKKNSTKMIILKPMAVGGEHSVNVISAVQKDLKGFRL